MVYNVNKLNCSELLSEKQIQKIMKNHSTTTDSSEYILTTRKQARVYGFKYYKGKPCSVCGNVARTTNNLKCSNYCGQTRGFKDVKHNPTKSYIKKRVKLLPFTKKPNDFIDMGDHVIIIVNSNTYGTYHISVDSEDYYNKLRYHKWGVCPQNIASDGKNIIDIVCRNTNLVNGSVKVKIHQLITGQLFIDHVDGNKFNNRKYNLRPSTKSENALNRNVIVSKSGYKCVYTLKNSYTSSIVYKGKKHYLGAYKTAIEAAIAYDIVAYKLAGSFAALNRNIAPSYNDDFHKLSSKSINNIKDKLQKKFVGIFG